MKREDLERVKQAYRIGLEHGQTLEKGIVSEFSLCQAFNLGAEAGVECGRVLGPRKRRRARKGGRRASR